MKLGHMGPNLKTTRDLSGIYLLKLTVQNKIKILMFNVINIRLFSFHFVFYSDSYFRVLFGWNNSQKTNIPFKKTAFEK